MKPQASFRRLKVIFLMSFVVLFMSCGSFETVSYYNDGIYGDEAVATQPKEKASNGTYYKKYFDEKAEEADQHSGTVLFTDPNTYSDTGADTPENNQYQSYGNWGDQTDQIHININGYFPYHYGYSSYYYWDRYHRPWWRHRYRPWNAWSYHYYPNYYFGWYGHYSPYYSHYPYYYPSYNRYHNGYYNNYGTGVSYSRSKGRRGNTSTSASSNYVTPRNVSGQSRSTTNTTARNYSNTGRAVSSNNGASTSKTSSGFMNRDYTSSRVYQRNDGRKAVSAGGSNKNNYQVRSYRSNNTSSTRSSQNTRSSNYTNGRSQPSYNNSSNSRSSSSYSSGRSYSRSSSSSRRSSSGSSRSSSSGRR